VAGRGDRSRNILARLKDISLNIATRERAVLQMTDETNPIQEFAAPFRIITNSLHSTLDATYVAKKSSGQLSTFLPGKNPFFARPTHLYRVDVSWHQLTAVISTQADSKSEPKSIQVKLRWRVSDAVAAVREGVRDVSSIINRFLEENLQRIILQIQEDDPSVAARRIAERLEESWRHPALETDEFHVVLDHSGDQGRGHHEWRYGLQLRRDRMTDENYLRELAASVGLNGAEWDHESAFQQILAALNERNLLSKPNFDQFSQLQHTQSEATEIPVTIYLSNEAAHDQVEAAVEQMLHAAGLEVAHRSDPIIGSWFRNLKARLRNFARTPLGQDAAVLGLHAAKNALVHTQEAEITSKLMENVGPVIESLSNTNEAVIRVGALLIVKTDGAVAVQQLTPSQQQFLYYKPQLLKAPRDILAVLEGFQSLPEHPASLGDSEASNRALDNGHEAPPSPPAIS
jgi:hypothetical protein